MANGRRPKTGIPVTTKDAKEFNAFKDELYREQDLFEGGVPSDDVRGSTSEPDPLSREPIPASTPKKTKVSPAAKEKQDKRVDEGKRDAKKLESNPHQGRTPRRGLDTRLQLNHLVFQIPPEQIDIQHEIKNVSMGVLRSPSTQKVRTGHGFVQVTIPLVFPTIGAVNDELVPLLYMLRKTPYCWTRNEYLQKTLMPNNTIDAMMLTLQAITVQSVPNLPTTFQAVLQFLFFNYKPYIDEILFRKYHFMNLKMEPEAFGPEAFTGESPYDGSIDFGTAELTYQPPRNRFQEHLVEVEDELDKPKQKKLYDYLQQAVSNPAHSEAWAEFIKGASQNELNGRTEFGPSIPPDRYFRMAWKEYTNAPTGVPEGEGWELESSDYAIYSRLHEFNAQNEFLPIHVSVQFAHRIASLPLLSQQLPTHQYLGPTDREITIVFNVTQEGKFLLEDFRDHIERFEQHVIEYRNIAKNQYMEIQTPLAKAAGLVLGNFGYKVIPENIDIETTPGNPGNTQMRVTFSEFNPSSHEKPQNPGDRERAILKSFLAGVFNRLSGGRPADIIEWKAINMREDLVADTVGVLDYPLRQPKVGKPELEVMLKQIQKYAERRGLTNLYNCVYDIVALTQERELFTQYGPGDPVGFAYATDDQTYGLKSIVEINPYWSGDVAFKDEVDLKAQGFEKRVRQVLIDYLVGDLADTFPSLALEFVQVNVDLSACYPDMSLPEHPATGRVVDTEADFYLVDSPLLREARGNNKTWIEEHFKNAVGTHIGLNLATKIDGTDDQLDIVEPVTSVEYKQGGRVPTKRFAGIDKKQYGIEGEITAQETEVGIITHKDGFIGNIEEDSIIKAGMDAIDRHAKLGMRKAFPTFRLNFVKEGRREVDYNNFYEARGGFAVKEIRVIRSRKIPTDTCVIEMVNLDGFLETDSIDDIRREDLHTKQSRYQSDNRELFYKYDDQIKSQLQIHNNARGTDVQFTLVRQIMQRQNADPAPGGYGPLGVTPLHGWFADGKDYSSDQLKDSVTNIRIGTQLICRIAQSEAQYKNEPLFNEIVATYYRFPNLTGEINRAIEADIAKNGTITSSWHFRVRNSKLNEFAEGIRTQESNEAATRRFLVDKQIKRKEDELDTIKDANPWVKTGPGESAQAAKDAGVRRDYFAQTQKQVAEREEEIKELKKERGKWVREPVNRGIIFKEGTDIVLKMGYSNNPEKLETVFIGHVTEVQPGPGTLQIIAQSFATELIQDIKGVEDSDFTMRGASNPTEIANWIMSFPEAKHFGRWEDGQQIIEEERNMRGLWYKKWNWSNNPSDDNIYVNTRDVPYMTQANEEFTLNGRTLWQGLLDLSLMFPGYVMGIRPYNDLDRQNRRRWRNTIFIGAPDMTYLSRVPDDWKKVQSELKQLEARFETAFDPTGFAEANFALESNIFGYGDQTERRANQQLISERSLAIQESQSMRREPFRRYHMISSYTDIIDNAIILTKRDVANGIKLRGRRGGWKYPGKGGNYIERQLDGMDESHINWQYVENDNAVDDRGQRMATSLLMYSLRDIYDGEITLLGNPAIQPFDVCFLNDFYNDMSGPFEVEQVVHTFSESTGFITQLKPDLVTSIGESAQRTAFGAIGAYAYRTLLNSMNIEWDNRANDVLYGMVDGSLVPGSPGLAGGAALIGAMTAFGIFARFMPLFAAPLVLASYFIGGYLRDHAIIRVVPLFHKGIPYVTGLEGFQAPETSDVLLNQFRLMRRGFREGVDATQQLFADFFDPERSANVRRSIGG